MLEVCVKFICAVILSVYGFYIIKKITNSNVKFLCKKTIIGITILCMTTLLSSREATAGIKTIAIFALQIIVYKEIFDIKVEESLIACGVLMMLTVFGDLISGFLRFFFSMEEIRKNIFLYALANIFAVTSGLITIKIKFILRQLQNFYNNISKNKSLSNGIFIVLLIVGLSSLGKNISKNGIELSDYCINFTIMLIFLLLAYLFIKSKNSYEKLNSEYESLFSYVQNFEDWIEKEQLNRHEYKNQLAVLR